MKYIKKPQEEINGKVHPKKMMKLINHWKLKLI